MARFFFTFCLTNEANRSGPGFKTRVGFLSFWRINFTSYSKDINHTTEADWKKHCNAAYFTCSLMCLTLIIRVSLLLTFIFGSLVKHADAAGLYNRAELACLSVLFRNFQTKSTADCFFCTFVLYLLFTIVYNKVRPLISCKLPTHAYTAWHSLITFNLQIYQQQPWLVCWFYPGDAFTYRPGIDYVLRVVTAISPIRPHRSFTHKDAALLHVY